MELLNLFKRHLATTASKSTAKNYLSDIRHFVAWFEANLKLPFDVSRVNSDILVLYEKTLGGTIVDEVLVPNSQISSASMKRHLSSLRKFFTFLEENKLNTSNPFRQIVEKITEIPTDYWHLKSFKDHLTQNKVSKLTIKNYISDMQGFAKWYEEAILPSIQKPLTSTGGLYLITQNVVEEYRKRLIEIQRAAPRTINRKLSSLRKYLDFASQKGFISGSEIILDPMPLNVKTHEFEENEVKVSLGEISNNEEKKLNYSAFPPFRLVQKILIFPYLNFEQQAANIIAGIITGKSVEGAYKIPKRVSQLLQEKKLLRSNYLTISSLLGAKNVAKEFYAPQNISLSGMPFHKRALHHIRHTRPAWYRKYHNYTFVHYVHFSLLVIFAAGVGVALYQNLVAKKQQSSFAAPTAPPRIMSFQGRLTDQNDNPITSATDIRFLIYNDPSASGAALLWQEVHYVVTPDQDGIFSLLLGTKTTIPSTVFSDNSSIYLGVSIGQTSELTPRQRIASVGYATNAEFLQGLPPTTQAGITSFANVVLALDSSGNLTLSDSSATNHTFSVTNGAFILAGQTLQLTTNTGSGGNVILKPDGLGKIDVQKPLVNLTQNGNLTPGGVEVNDKFGVLATESAVAAFTVRNDGGSDLFTASSSSTTRFTIANDGTLTIPVYNLNGGLLYGNGTGGLISQTTVGLAGQCLQSIGGGTPTWGTCGGSGSLWRINQGTISPINDTLDVLFGANSTASAKFRFLNIASGTPVASVSANSGNNAAFLAGDGTLGTTNRQSLTIGNSGTYNSTGNVLINPNGVGRIGVFTNNPLASFDLRGISGTQVAASISANTSNAALLIDNSGPGDFLTASKGGQIYFRLNANSGTYLGDPYDGELIVGKNGLGKVTAQIIDPTIVSNQKTSGTTSLTLHTTGASNADFIFQNQSTELARLSMAGQLRIPITGSSAGLVIGGDTQLFRGDTNRLDLASGDSFNIVSGSLLIGGTTVIDSSRNGTFNDISVAGTCTGCMPAAVDVSKWEILSGALSPRNKTLDLLVGSSSTSSAKFAILNIAGGTPTASVSSGLNGNGTYITAGGTIQTTNKQSLTIGGDTTGNIQIKPGNANNGLRLYSDGRATIGFSNDSSPTYRFEVAGGLKTYSYDLLGSTISDDSTPVLALGNTSFGFSTSTNLYLWGGTGGFVFKQSNGTEFARIDSTGKMGLGTSTPLSQIHVTRPLSLGTTGKALGIFDQIESQDILAASASGTTRFVINNNGNIQAGFGQTALSTITKTGATARTYTLPDETGTLCIQGSSNCGFSIGTNYWQLNNNLLSPSNSTFDFAVGGTATTSAKFAVLNIAGGTPTASISANSGNNALFLTGTGNVATTNMQTLTLGGATTGNIVIDSGSSAITLADNTTISGNLTVSGSTTAIASTTINLTGSNPTIATTTTNSGFTLQPNGSGNLTVLLNSTGDFVIDDGGSVANLTYTDTGTLQVNNVLAAQQGLVVTLDSANTTTTGIVDFNFSSLTTNNTGLNIDYQGLSGAASGADLFAAKINIGNDDNDSNVFGLKITGDNDAGTLEAYTGIWIDTLDTSVGNMVDGILVTSSGVASGVTDAIDVSAANIDNALNAGGNFILLDATRIFGDASGSITFEDTSGNDFMKITDIGNYATVGIGTSNAQGLLHLNGGDYGGNAALIVNQTGISTNDILAASSSGVAKFRITNDGTASSSAGFTIDGAGNIQSTRNQTLTIGGGSTGNLIIGRASQATYFAGFENCTLKTTTGGLLNCGTDLQGSGGGSNWVLSSANGTLNPINNTLDILVGGTATTSAKFAVLNIAGGTPTASVSSGLNGTGTYITADGTLATTRRQTLTIGNSSSFNTTGNVLINSNEQGNVGIGTTSPVAALHVYRTGTLNPLVKFEAGSGGSLMLSSQNDGINLKLVNVPGNDNFTTGTVAGDSGIVYTNSYGFILGPENNSVLMRIDTSKRVGFGTTSPLSQLHITRPLSFGATGKALAIFDQIENQDIFTASASGLTRFVIHNDGRVEIGTLNAPGNFAIGDPMLRVYSTLGTAPAASISARTSGPSLLVTNEGAGDLIVASSSGNTYLRLTTQTLGGGFSNVGSLVVGNGGLGKIYAGDIDPPYTIDGEGYATFAPATFLPTEEYTGKAVVAYDPSEGAYAYKLDFNNFEYKSDLWVFNRIIYPDISEVKVFTTPNSQARTWYKKDGTNRTITLYSDRPTEISYRMTAYRFNYKDYKTFTGIPMGHVAPPPTTTGNNANDNNIAADPYFETLSISQQNGKWVIKDSNQNPVNHIDAFSKAIIAFVKAGYIEAQQMTTGSINASTGFFATLSGNTLSFANGTISNFTAAISNLGNATASTFAVTSETLTIGGKNIRDFIIETVRNAGFTNEGGNIASSNEVKTNVISPLSEDGNVNVNGKLVILGGSEGSQAVSWFDNNGNASISADLVARGIAAIDATFSGTLAVANAEIQTSRIQNLQSENSTISGSLAAGSLATSNASVSESLTTNSLNSTSASISGTLAANNIRANQFQIGGNLSATNVSAQFGIFEHGITSMGPITANILTATDQLAVGANFSISNNAINTIGTDLEIQSFRQGNIAFQGGLITMDTDGNMQINGNLNVLGEIDAVFGVFSGTLTTPSLITKLISPLPGDDLTIRLSDNAASQSSKLRVENARGHEVLSINNRGDIISSGAATLSKLNFNLVGQAQATTLTEAVATGSAGFATLRAGQPEITIINPNVTSKSLIYITPFGDTGNKVLYLLRQIPESETEDGSFTVGVSGTTTQNIQFNWLILN